VALIFSAGGPTLFEIPKRRKPGGLIGPFIFLKTKQRTMRLFFLTIALFFLLSGCGYYVPHLIVKEQEKYIEIKEEAPDNYGIAPDGSLQGPDSVFLSPIEVIPDDRKRFLRTFETAGNWGYKYLELDKWESLIRDKAQRELEFYIFDTGGKYDHPDLTPITRPGKSFTGEGSLLDGHGHSTHVGGIIAGRTNTGAPIGVVSSLRDKGLVHLTPVKVLSNKGGGTYNGIAQGIAWANQKAKQDIAKGRFVIYNFSLGGGSQNARINQLLKEAVDLGVLVVMAANGNAGQERIYFPSSSPSAKSISSIGQRGDLSRFSNFGVKTYAGLPGEGIYSNFKGGLYKIFSGTSMASPHAAGVAGLVASCYPDASADDILKHMAENATDLGAPGHDKKFGFGTLKVGELINKPIGERPGPPSPPDNPGDDPAEPPTPPDDPTPPDQPDKPDSPLATYSFELSDVYSTRWRTMDDPTYHRLRMEIKLEIEGPYQLSDAASRARFSADSFFSNRGFIFQKGTTELEAVFWVGWFFDLISKRNDWGTKIQKAVILIDGARYEFCDFERKPTAETATRKGAITFTW